MCCRTGRDLAATHRISASTNSKWRRIDRPTEIRSLAETRNDRLIEQLERINGGTCAVYLWEDGDFWATCAPRETRSSRLVSRSSTGSTECSSRSAAAYANSLGIQPGRLPAIWDHDHNMCDVSVGLVVVFFDEIGKISRPPPRHCDLL